MLNDIRFMLDKCVNIKKYLLTVYTIPQIHEKYIYIIYTIIHKDNLDNFFCKEYFKFPYHMDIV